MSDDSDQFEFLEDSSEDEYAEIQEDPLESYDARAVNMYGVTISFGRKALFLKNGNYERAEDLIQRTQDMETYLASIGAIRRPLLDEEVLLEFCAKRVEHRTFDYGLLSSLPADVVDRFSLIVQSDNITLCSQEGTINAMCQNAPDPRRCYENTLGFASMHTNSSIVLSKQLLRFLCSNVNRQIRHLQHDTITRVDQCLELEWDRFMEIRGPVKLDAVEFRTNNILPAEVSLIVSKYEHIDMLIRDYGLSDGVAREHTTLNAFRSFVTKRLRESLFRPNIRKFEDAFMQNRIATIQILRR